MDALWQALADGRLLDGVIAGVALEIVVLLLWQRRTGAGLPPRELLPTALAGLCLMLALRAALAGADARWIGAALLGAGLAHGLDLRGRWRAAARRGPGAAQAAMSQPAPRNPSPSPATPLKPAPAARR